MKRKFYGYKIIQQFKIHNITFYIGFSKREKKPYATFFSRDGEKDFMWIRFFNDLYAAQKDIVERSHRELPSIEFDIEMREETIYGDKT